jgi:hypothetical protein
MTIKNDEFKVHILNEAGIQKAQELGGKFDEFLTNLDLNKDRYGAIVRTKLEEACFFAKKSLASKPENQK